MLRNRSLRATIALAFASLLMIMAAVIAFAVREMQATQAERRLVSDELLPAADAADRMALNALRFDNALQDFVTMRSPDDLDLAHISRGLFQRAAAELGRVRLTDPRLQYLAGQVQTAADDFAKQAPQAEQYAISTPPTRATAFDHQYLQGTLGTIVTTAEGLGNRLEREAAIIRGQITLREERLTRSLVFAFALAGCVGIVLVLYCLRLVTEPVGRLVLAARAVEAGDYSRARRLGETEAGSTREGSQNELAALTRAFAHMAGALEEREQRLRAQATDLAETNAHLTALQSLTDVALSDLPLNSLLQQLLQRAVSGVGGDAGAIFLRDPVSGRLEQRASLNIDGPDDPVAGAAVEEWLASVAPESPVLACGDRATQPQPGPFPLAERDVAAFLAVPIRLTGQVIGVAHIDFDRPCVFEPSVVHLAQLFGERIARAVERARAMAELEAWGHELERRVEQQKAQLQRTEHLAAIGLVGGSIAHELRNPLGVISNAVYFLRRRAGVLDEKMQRHLEIIEREVKHSSRIIDGLVDYSSGIEPVSQGLDLNGLIRTALEYCAVPETIPVELHLDENMPMVVGDEAQLLQVFEHLIRNAVQAMEGQGTLRISTGAAHGAIWAAIQDTGPGVPPEDQSRIFEPLVTTRAKGMGLGLALAKKILEAHSGEIRLASEPGCGATFTVELPLTDRALPPPAAQPAPLSSQR